MSRNLYFTITIAVLLFAITHNIKKPNQEENISTDGNFRESEVIPIEAAIGPESFAFDPLGGGPYTGLSNGWIIKWEANERRWVNFAVTSPTREACHGSHDDDRMEHICGRPLGMCFNQTAGDLYIADAYMGLLKVGPEGGLATRIATHAQGIPFEFTNGLDIDQSSGAVYFTDSSSVYQRRNYISVIISGDKTGRLMKYDSESKQVTLILDNLALPNGVALSKDGNYILLAETTNCRILKYWLKTSKAGKCEVFAQLPGFPDNIKRSPRGGFWVGIHSRKDKILGWILSYPWVGNALLRLPIDIKKVYSILADYRGSSGLAVRLSEDGDVLEILEDKVANLWRSISEVGEKDGTLWIGSINSPFVGMYKI